MARLFAFVLICLFAQSAAAAESAATTAARNVLAVLNGEKPLTPVT